MGVVMNSLHTWQRRGASTASNCGSWVDFQSVESGTLGNATSFGDIASIMTASFEQPRLLSCCVQGVATGVSLASQGCDEVDATFDDARRDRACGDKDELGVTSAKKSSLKNYYCIQPELFHKVY